MGRCRRSRRRGSLQPHPPASPGTSPQAGTTSPSSGQAFARGCDLAGDLIFVAGKQSPPAHDHPPIHDHGLGSRWRREHDGRDEVFDAGMRQIIDPEARDVGALARLENTAIIAAEALRPATCRQPQRSEEHTSELQSPCNLVCRLLLEKKKKKTKRKNGKKADGAQQGGNTAEKATAMAADSRHPHAARHAQVLADTRHVAMTAASTLPA